jgi:DNA-binding CsgD family transcriptional regulator
MKSALLYDSIVTGLYESATDPSKWSATLSSACSWVGANGFHFLGWNTAQNTSNFGIVSEEFQTSAVAEYESYYGSIDPRLKILNRERTGRLVLCQDHFDASFVRKNEYYQEFLRKYEVRFLAGSTLIRTFDSSVVLALLKDARGGPYSTEQIRRINRVLPHINRAAVVQRRMDELESTLNFYRSAVNSTKLRVLAVSEDLEVLYVSRAAESSVAGNACITFKQGHLSATNPSQQISLRNAVRVALASDKPLFVALRRGSGDAECEYLTIKSLPGGHPLLGVGRRSGVIVFMSDLYRPPSSVQLAQLFNLTGAETRLAIALTQGKRVEDYAAEASLQITTVRTQLRAILTKTHTRRQTDVVRLFNSINSVAGDDS